MTTKKLYKIKTKTILYETYEVEADSYDKALDSIFEGQDNHHDDYPVNVDRTGFWYDHKQFIDDYDELGLAGVSVSVEEFEKLSSWEQVDTEMALGWWREPTDEERVADEKQAVADGRLNEKFASYT